MVATRSAAASSTHRLGSRAASVVIRAATRTIAAAPAAKPAAETTRAPRRAGTLTGSVRRYVSHGDVRSTAMPTPNWKNATPIAAKPAKAAILIVAYEPGEGATKKRKNTVGNSSVGTRYAGYRTSSRVIAPAWTRTSLNSAPSAP